METGIVLILKRTEYTNKEEILYELVKDMTEAFPDAVIKCDGPMSKPMTVSSFRLFQKIDYWLLSNYIRRNRCEWSSVKIATIEAGALYVFIRSI